MSYSIPDEMCGEIIDTLKMFQAGQLEDPADYSIRLVPMTFAILAEQLKALSFISWQLEDLQKTIVEIRQGQ